MITKVTQITDQLNDGTIGPSLIRVPKGEFYMGSESYHDNQKPRHFVKIFDDFAISQYPVTFKQFDHYAQQTGKNKSYYTNWRNWQHSIIESLFISHHKNWPDDNGLERDKRSVFNISWFEAKQYCHWLSAQTKKKYRLPTEAEWEYAAQWNQTNLLGIKDMCGHIWQWIEDDYHINYQHAPQDGSKFTSCFTLKDIDNHHQSIKVIRGGSAISDQGPQPITIRNKMTADQFSANIGFRLVREL